MRRLRPLFAGLALGIALAFVPVGNAVAAADDEAPTAPGDLRVVERELSTIGLDWDAASDNVGVTHYRVSYNDDEFVRFTTETSYRLWRLLPDTEYRVRVAAVDASGNMSPARAVVTSTLVDTEPPTAPVLSIAGQSATSVDLSWTYGLDNDGGMGYLDYLVDDGTVTRTVHLSSFLRITGLATNQTYTFTVRARDRSGNLSAPTSATTTLENTPPSPPTNLRVIGSEGGQSVFGWDPATDDSGRILQYIVVFHTGQITTSGLSVSIAGLIVDCLLPPDPDLVTFTVRAQDPSGNVSAPATIQVPVV